MTVLMSGAFTTLVGVVAFGAGWVCRAYKGSPVRGSRRS